MAKAGQQRRTQGCDEGYIETVGQIAAVSDPNCSPFQYSAETLGQCPSALNHTGIRRSASGEMQTLQGCGLGNISRATPRLNIQTEEMCRINGSADVPRVELIKYGSSLLIEQLVAVIGSSLDLFPAFRVADPLV